MEHFSFDRIDAYLFSRTRNRSIRSNRSRSKTIILASTLYVIAISASILLFVAIGTNVSKVLDDSSQVISIPMDLRNNVDIDASGDTQTTIDSYGDLTKNDCWVAQSVDAKQKRCFIYSPYVDLRDHLEHEEALQQHQSIDPAVIPLLLRKRPTQNYRAILTRCGYKGGNLDSQINQDRAIIISPFLINDKGAIKVIDSATSFIMGIFDGHGENGHVVAQHAAQTLSKTLSDQLELLESNNDSPIKNALVQAFIKVDSTIPKNINVLASGCTASVILRLHSKIYVANAGDSQSYIVSYHRQTKVVRIVYITRKDKPDLEDERKRIEVAGGTVYIPPDPYLRETLKLSSRVLIPISPLSQIGLAMSRSIGDHGGKDLGVIAEPIVDVLDVQSLKSVPSTHHNGSLRVDSNNGDNVELFAVSASDGLLDYIEPLAVARYLATSLYREGDGDAPSVLEACEQLIQKSSKMWIARGIGYRDDISLAVNKIET